MAAAPGSAAPLVVVLIPVFGADAALRDTLESLSRARLPSRLVTLIVDDGSDPPVVLPGGAYAGLGPRIERLPQNLGIEGALNHGLRVVRDLGGDFVARLDAGDTIDPQRLEKQARVLEQDAGVGLVASDAWFADRAGRRLFRFRAPRSDAQARRAMHLNSCLLHPTVMLRMRVLDSTGPYSSAYPAAEDYELFFRLMQHARVAVIGEALTTLAPGGISLRRRRAQVLSRLRVQWRYFDRRRWESYGGVALTLLLLLVPNRFVLALKRLRGVSSL